MKIIVKIEPSFGSTLRRTKRYENESVPFTTEYTLSFSFPIIKSVIPKLISTNIISVQPMTGPSSNLFYLDYQC